MFQLWKQAYTFLKLAPISFTTKGIAKILSKLESNKTSGPDKMHPFILKYYANEIALIAT